MIKRIAVAVLIAATPVVTFAQNDVGIWLNSTQLRTTSITGLGGVEFDRKAGYGLSLSHSTSKNLSTEFGFSQLRGSANVHFPSALAQQDVVALDAGSFHASVASAVVQWHLNRDAAISPYIGAGAAYFDGAKLTTRNDDSPLNLVGTTYRFADRFTYVANAGLNFAIHRNLSLAVDGKYMPYRPSSALGKLDFNPVTIGLGARFRM